MMETDKPSVINKNCHIRFSCLWNDDIVSISASLNIPGFNIFSWPQPFQPKRSKDPNRRICAISAPVIINHFVLVTMTWLFHLLFNIGFTLFDDSFLLVTPNPMFFISCQNSKQNQSYRVVKIRELKPNKRNESDVALHTNSPFCTCTCVLPWRRYNLLSTHWFLRFPLSQLPTLITKNLKPKSKIRND